MELTWDPVNDESELIAVAREVRKGEKEAAKNAPYKLVYITPLKKDAPHMASRLVADEVPSFGGGAGSKRSRPDVDAFSEGGSSRLIVPPGYQFEPVPPVAEEKEEEVDGRKQTVTVAPRKIIYVTGRSGRGKSYWILTYVKNYVKMYPDNNVFLISGLKKDATLDSMPNIQRIDLDKLVASPVTDVEGWKNSLVIIDDIESLEKNPTGKVKFQAILQVQDMIASEGRHSHTTLLRSSHAATDYNKTRLILKETHGYVIYPGGDENGYIRLLTTYGGFSKKMAESLLDIPERWVYIHHDVPQFIMTPTTVSLMTKKK